MAEKSIDARRRSVGYFFNSHTKKKRIMAGAAKNVKSWGLQNDTDPMDLCPICTYSVMERCFNCPWEHRLCAMNHRWCPCPAHPTVKVQCTKAQQVTDHHYKARMIRETQGDTMGCICYRNDPNTPSAAWPKDLFGFKQLVPEVLQRMVQEKQERDAAAGTGGPTVEDDDD